MLTDKRKDYLKSYRQKLKEEGRCLECRKHHDGPFINCTKCLEIIKKRQIGYQKLPKTKELTKIRHQSVKHKTWRNNYEKQRRKNNINARLADSLRSRLRIAIKRKTRAGSFVRDLGCDIPSFKIYLESQFIEGMSWENWGNGTNKWSIDHIIPLSSVNLSNREEFLKVCHYTNMRPLWSIENSKKCNKME